MKFPYPIKRSVPARVVAVVAALSLSACGGLTNTAAATVWGEDIPAEAVEAQLEEFRSTPRYAQLSDQEDIDQVERQFLQGILAGMVRRALLEPIAEREGVSVSDADVDAEIELIKADFPDETAFEEALKEQALTEERLRELIADRMLEDRIREKVTAEAGVSQDEVVAYYDENIEDFQETCAQHILIESDAEARIVAAQLQRAKPSKIDGLFKRLAAERSRDSASAPNSGDLGCVPPGQFVPEFEEAMNELEIGEISDPVQTQFGFHVIRVNERRTVPFSQVEAQIFEQLSGTSQDDAWEAFITGLYEEADVEIDPRYGVLDVVTGQILDPDASSVPGAQAPKATEPTAAPEIEAPQP
ncbi:MAG: peptidylprolyl isomerase [Actinomycetota bacterium]